MRRTIPFTALMALAIALAHAAPAHAAPGPEAAAVAGAGPEGWWKTIDDKSGQAKSIVHIRASGEGLTGTVEKLFRKPDEEQDPVCRACAGERKDKPIKGMTILWGLRPAEDGWEGGSILDPNNGKVYRCKLSLSPDGNALTVRGYLGISLLGRSQTWKRAPEGEVPPSP